MKIKGNKKIPCGLAKKFETTEVKLYDFRFNHTLADINMHCGKKFNM